MAENSQMLLTEKEVREVTGYTQVAKQADWLTRNRITYFINGKGRIIVTWASVNAPHQKSREPDFTCLANAS